MASLLDTVGADIISELKKVLGGAFDKIKGSAEKEAQYFAAQAVWIAKARADGEFDDDQLKWALSKLQDQTESYCRVLCALTILTIEQAWNAVVGVIWKAIDGALKGTGLGGILIPAAPSA